jgi:hypothetical protein
LSCDTLVANERYVLHLLLRDHEVNERGGRRVCAHVFILRNTDFNKCVGLCISVDIRVSDIYFYFQTKSDAIHLLQHIDSKLGVPLAERSYGGNCRIYDQDVPEDPFHNIYVSHVLFGVCGKWQN